jgi:hypothetical protein
MPAPQHGTSMKTIQLRDIVFHGTAEKRRHLHEIGNPPGA